MVPSLITNPPYHPHTSLTHPIQPKIDILINSAGISQTKLLLHTGKFEIDELLSTNLLGTILGCKYIGKSMIAHTTAARRSAKAAAAAHWESKLSSPSNPSSSEPVQEIDITTEQAELPQSQKLTPEEEEDEEATPITPEPPQLHPGSYRTGSQGVIINIASLLATKAITGSAVYAATKAGVLGLTNTLAMEYGQSGVRVNAIVPGYIHTPMTKGKPLSPLSYFSFFVQYSSVKDQRLLSCYDYKTPQAMSHALPFSISPSSPGQIANHTQKQNTHMHPTPTNSPAPPHSLTFRKSPRYDQHRQITKPHPPPTLRHPRRSRRCRLLPRQKPVR